MSRLPIPFMLALFYCSCMEGPPGTDGAGPIRDSIILDYKSAWEYNFLHHPFYEAVFELSDAELESYQNSDTSNLKRDSSAHALFAVPRYSPREWAVYYETTDLFRCEADTVPPTNWVARFKDASGVVSSTEYCVDSGDPYVPTKGNALIQYFEGKGFDISNYFIWEQIPIGKIRIYYR